jgi:GNAT superfamily N-acetyltransferase
MHTCTLHDEFEIVPGDLGDYRRLAPYHYRDGRPSGVTAIFALKPKERRGALGDRALGVIVYTRPVPTVELRNRATGNLFKGFDRQTQLALINRNIRCISRVIVEPRVRGIGLATRLVRETLGRVNVAIVEAMGVMPRMNPFFEKAGMTAFRSPVRLEQVELVEALSLAGIEDRELIDPEAVQTKLDALSPSAAEFIEVRVQQFLKNRRHRRTMLPGLERTRYLLSKLTPRPIYHIWYNPKIDIGIP